MGRSSEKREGQETKIKEQPEKKDQDGRLDKQTGGD